MSVAQGAGTPRSLPDGAYFWRGERYLVYERFGLDTGECCQLRVSVDISDLTRWPGSRRGVVPRSSIPALVLLQPGKGLAFFFWEVSARVAVPTSLVQILGFR